MPNRDPLPTPGVETPRGPVGTGGVPDRTQEKPPLTPTQDPGIRKTRRIPLWSRL